MCYASELISRRSFEVIRMATGRGWLKCPGPWPMPGRRELLRAGLAGFAGLSLPELLRQRTAVRAETSRRGDSKRTSVILVWLPGGHSHIETYDPKPKAPSDYRGPFQPIATNVPG